MNRLRYLSLDRDKALKIATEAYEHEIEEIMFINECSRVYAERKLRKQFNI